MPVRSISKALQVECRIYRNFKYFLIQFAQTGGVRCAKIAGVKLFSNDTNRTFRSVYQPFMVCLSTFYVSDSFSETLNAHGSLLHQ